MTATEASSLITAIALLLGSFGSIGTLVTTVLNRRESRERGVVLVGAIEAVHKSTDERSEVLAGAIEAVHKSTNGMSIRNEAIAKKLGVAEGTATGLAEGRAENPK